MEPSKVGKWEREFPLLNVCIHASLLPTGKILYWGRRKNPWNDNLKDLASMNEQKTSSFILDLNAKGKPSKPIAEGPKDFKGENEVNLFCSGHTFQPDGKLLVVGGHLEDGKGLDQACIFNPFDGEGKWEAKQPMGKDHGRWYPTAIKLPDGNILVVSGSAKDFIADRNPQLWRGDKWELVQPPDINTSMILYSRLCIDPTGIGSVFMSGPQAKSQWILPPVDKTVGAWDVKAAERDDQREYAPSVMYDSGKVLYIGGGTQGDGVPASTCAVISLADSAPKWKPAESMTFRRRQHNATILPNGKILVTGGTSGTGFNNTSSAVLTPELWDPKAQEARAWKKMAPEGSVRCYHSIALLLPTGQVLSAGGGEWIPGGTNQCNEQEDTLTNAQIFNPPYLFDDKNQPAMRPTISNAPTSVNYKDTITVTLDANDDVGQVTWIHIGSVTHCNNQSQSFLDLTFRTKNLPKLEIDVPATPNLATPGHYMLFVLNKKGVPAIAPIIRLNTMPWPPKSSSNKLLARHVAVEDHVPFDHHAINDQMIADQKRPAIVLGLTPVCPYGLGPCWGGAYEGLQQISDVELVRPVPNRDDSLAFVYTEHDIIPDIDVWRSEFQQLTGGAYTWRGIQMTLSGVVTATGDKLTLAGNDTRPELLLAPFKESSKIKWDLATSALKPMSEAEASAYARLAAAVAQSPITPIQVTGTLQKLGDGKFSLDVNEFAAVVTQD